MNENMTGYPSIDRPWLKYYSEEAIHAPLPDNFHILYQKWRAGKITGTAAAKACGMPLATFRYRAEVYEKS